MEAFYTVKEVAVRTGLSIPTIRYYDSMGLIPQLHRTSGGIRQFTEQDICRMELICCLKNSGMPLQKIRMFMELCQDKEAVEERKKMLEEHREFIIKQIEALQCSLCTVEYKIEHYKDVGVFHI